MSVPHPKTAEAKRSAAQLAGIIAVTILAGYIRFISLGKLSLWMDEGSTFAITQLSRADFHSLLITREMNMALYYLALRLVPPMQASEVGLRFLPALFGVLTVPLVWWLTRTVLPPPNRRGLSFLAAALAACNGFLITYSQEARGYSIALFFSTLALALALHILRGGNASKSWALCVVLALYSHFYTVLWTLPQAWFVVRELRRRDPRRLRSIILIFAIGLIPLVAFLAHTRGGQLDWLPPLSLSAIYETVRQVAGYSGVAALFLYCGALGGLVIFLREATPSAMLIVTQVVVPPVLILLGSFVHPLLAPRFLIFILPALFVCAARGVQDLRPTVIVALSAALFAATISAKSHRPPQPNWSDATEFLCQGQQDAVFFSPAMAKFPFEFYQRKHPGCAPAIAPGSLHVDKRDFFSGKKDLAAQACSLEAKHPLLVVDGASSFDPAALTGNCYREVRRMQRDNLNMVELAPVIEGDRRLP